MPLRTWTSKFMQTKTSSNKGRVTTSSKNRRRSRRQLNCPLTTSFKSPGKFSNSHKASWMPLQTTIHRFSELTARVWPKTGACNLSKYTTPTKAFLLTWKPLILSSTDLKKSWSPNKLWRSSMISVKTLLLWYVSTTSFAISSLILKLLIASSVTFCNSMTTETSILVSTTCSTIILVRLMKRKKKSTQPCKITSSSGSKDHLLHPWSSMQLKMSNTYPKCMKKWGKWTSLTRRSWTTSLKTVKSTNVLQSSIIKFCLTRGNVLDTDL